jgi:hypothetical protein
LEKFSFPRDKLWSNDPHFSMATEKGKQKLGPDDHKNRPLEENLANKNSWLEVKAILEVDEDLAKVIVDVFP